MGHLELNCATGATIGARREAKKTNVVASEAKQPGKDCSNVKRLLRYARNDVSTSIAPSRNSKCVIIVSVTGVVE